VMYRADQWRTHWWPKTPAAPCLRPSTPVHQLLPSPWYLLLLFLLLLLRPPTCSCLLFPVMHSRPSTSLRPQFLVCAKLALSVSVLSVDTHTISLSLSLSLSRLCTMRDLRSVQDSAIAASSTAQVDEHFAHFFPCWLWRGRIDWGHSSSFRRRMRWCLCISTSIQVPPRTTPGTIPAGNPTHQVLIPVRKVQGMTFFSESEGHVILWNLSSANMVGYFF
jgi:hypothetical protein